MRTYSAEHLDPGYNVVAIRAAPSSRSLQELDLHMGLEEICRAVPRLQADWIARSPDLAHLHLTVDLRNVEESRAQASDLVEEVAGRLRSGGATISRIEVVDLDLDDEERLEAPLPALGYDDWLIWVFLDDSDGLGVDDLTSVLREADPRFDDLESVVYRPSVSGSGGWAHPSTATWSALMARVLQGDRTTERSLGGLTSRPWLVVTYREMVAIVLKHVPELPSALPRVLAHLPESVRYAYAERPTERTHPPRVSLPTPWSFVRLVDTNLYNAGPATLDAIRRHPDREIGVGGFHLVKEGHRRAVGRQSWKERRPAGPDRWIVDRTGM